MDDVSTDLDDEALAVLVRKVARMPPADPFEGVEPIQVAALVGEVQRLRDALADVASRRCLCGSPHVGHGGPCCGERDEVLS